MIRYYDQYQKWRSRGVKQITEFSTVHTRTVNTKGRGVRRNMITSLKKIYVPKQLYVCKPCYCGSRYHTKTSSLSCPLNPRYNDA